MSEMNCQTARELMLEADLGELSGEGELARHVRSCARCRQAANVIVSGYRDLNTGLSALQPGRVPSRRRPRARWLAVPLAAAAVLSLLLVRHEPLPAPPSPVLIRLLFPPPPVVTPPPGMQAMVIEGKDATVVWLY